MFAVITKLNDRKVGITVFHALRGAAIPTVIRQIVRKSE